MSLYVRTEQESIDTDVAAIRGRREKLRAELDGDNKRIEGLIGTITAPEAAPARKRERV